MTVAERCGSDAETAIRLARRGKAQLALQRAFGVASTAEEYYLERRRTLEASLWGDGVARPR